MIGSNKKVQGPAPIKNKSFEITKKSKFKRSWINCVFQCYV